MPQPDGQPPSAAWRRWAAIRSRFCSDFPGLLRNIPVLENAAAGRGLFSIRTERDGIVRRVPMVMQAQGNIMPSLSFEMLRVATGASTILIRMDAAGIKSVALPGFEMPTDRNGQLWVHFAPHDPGALRLGRSTCSKGASPPTACRARLVLIGTSAAGLLDLKTTPNDPAMPGVEIHAQVLESILSNAMLSQPNYAIGAELCAAFVMGVAIIWLAPILERRLCCCCSAPPSSRCWSARSWYLFARAASC